MKTLVLSDNEFSILRDVIMEVKSRMYFDETAPNFSFDGGWVCDYESIIINMDQYEMESFNNLVEKVY